ncbi:hypothetical protein VHUM_03239 [Vanrija humicola]|uniref:Acetoacetate decarboxylase n=1 Tax=Vanrija humicola TaxID=5417 RepID=A0A7D8YXA2_VANHU|nr:hypothetical protein VHUM_03239 [Vanrija humicola]
MSAATPPPAPPPWSLRATIYTIPLYTTPDVAASPAFADAAYAPLEAAAPFATGAAPVGGLSMVQLIRYSASPVGAYDEMLLIPGKFRYDVEGPDGKRQSKDALRVTRIYVSQRDTCYNGRKNWNIPKHLARFEWVDKPEGTTIKVFPQHSDSPEPYFQATFTAWSYVPAVPVSTRVAGNLLDMTLVQPPLPSGAAEEGDAAALTGTDTWCKVLPYIYSPRARLGWIDLQQAGGGSFAPFTERRWLVGAKLEDAVVEFGEGETWSAPASSE